MAKKTKTKKKASSARSKSKKASKKPKSVKKAPKKKKITKAKNCAKIKNAAYKPSKLVEDTIYAVAGETGVKIVNFLGEQKNVSEFIIADNLKLDMQTVRNTLYKMHTLNVATYIRKKDRQKGWYISYWTFNKARIKEVVVHMKKIQLENLRERLHKEEQSKGVFYICPKACARLDFDQATEFEFKCPECGSLLNQQENSRTIEHLKEKIHELECSMSS
jgi:transcription initiation factor TFIIE subunit alpha